MTLGRIVHCVRLTARVHGCNGILRASAALLQCRVGWAREPLDSECLPDVFNIVLQWDVSKPQLPVRRSAWMVRSVPSAHGFGNGFGNYGTGELKMLQACKCRQGVYHGLMSF